MNLERIRFKLNDDFQYPKNEYTCDFTPTSLDYSRVYASFLAAELKTHNVDTGTVVSFNDFERLYPIFHIDVSKKDLQIYEERTKTEIKVQYKLRTTPSENYNVYCIVQFEKQAELKVLNRKLFVTLLIIIHEYLFIIVRGRILPTHLFNFFLLNIFSNFYFCLLYKSESFFGI
jgi:hypothetical protein